MKIALGTWEIDDREREIIAAQLEEAGRRQAKGKKASRAEVKMWLEDAIYLQTESLESWWEEMGPGAETYDDDDW